MGDKLLTSVLLTNRFSSFCRPESGFSDFTAVPLALRVTRLFIFESGPRSLICVFSMLSSSSMVLPSMGFRLLIGLFCTLSSTRYHLFSKGAMSRTLWPLMVRRSSQRKFFKGSRLMMGNSMPISSSCKSTIRCKSRSLGISSCMPMAFRKMACQIGSRMFHHVVRASV